MAFNSGLMTSISDITLDESAKRHIKTEESADERVKRQKREFFNLLITQLQNQDPMEPMDTSTMTQQLFAINQVEQQLQTNQHLEDMKKYFITTQNASYLHYIGKTVDFPGDQVQVEGKNGHFSYEMEPGVTEAKIEIRNDKGILIHSEKLNTEPGFQSYVWQKPEQWPNGQYKFKVTLVDYIGEERQAKTYGSGKITGIVNEKGEQYFDINNNLVHVDRVRKISDRSEYTTALLEDISKQMGQLNGMMGGLPSSIAEKLPSPKTIVAPPSTPPTLPPGTVPIQDIPNFMDPSILEQLTSHIPGFDIKSVIPTN